MKPILRQSGDTNPAIRGKFQSGSASMTSNPAGFPIRCCGHPNPDQAEKEVPRGIGRAFGQSGGRLNPDFELKRNEKYNTKTAQSGNPGPDSERANPPIRKHAARADIPNPAPHANPQAQSRSTANPVHQSGQLAKSQKSIRQVTHISQSAQSGQLANPAKLARLANPANPE